MPHLPLTSKKPEGCRGRVQHPSTEAGVAAQSGQRRASQPVTSGAVVVRQRCSAAIWYQSTPP